MEWNRLENEQFSPLEAFTADEEGKPPIQARHFPMISICYVSVFGIEHQSLLLSHLFYPCVPCRRTMYCLRIMNDVFRVPYTFVYDSVWNGDTTHIARICRQIAFQLLCLSNVCFDVRLRTRRRVSSASISHLSMGWVAIQCLFASILWHLISVAKSFSLSFSCHGRLQQSLWSSQCHSFSHWRNAQSPIAYAVLHEHGSTTMRWWAIALYVWANCKSIFSRFFLWLYNVYTLTSFDITMKSHLQYIVCLLLTCALRIQQYYIVWRNIFQ